MNELPNSWSHISLTSLYYLPTGVKEYEGVKPYYSTGSIKDDKFTSEGNYDYFNKPSRANRTSKVGDIFQARMKETNKVLLIDDELSDCLFSTGFFQLRPSKTTIDSKYLLYYLSSSTFLTYKDENCTGATQQSLNDTNAKKILIPLAPLNEQKRIAKKLDELLATVESIKTHLDNAPTIIKRFRQSILAAATSGKLTEEWREENKSKNNNLDDVIENLYQEGKTKGNFGNKKVRASAIKENNKVDIPKAWSLKRVGELCQCIVPNRDKPKSFTGNIPWITTPLLDDNSLYINQNSFDLGLSEEEVILYNARVIPTNAVIMTCVGKFGITSVLTQNAVINQQLHAFIPCDMLDSKFLAYMLKTKKKYMEDHATSTTIAYLNKVSCNSIPICIPPIEEQKEIVSQVESLFTLADTLEEKIEAAKKRVDKLTQSILAKAFRGELVEQDPNDESAEVLLERIRAEQEKEKLKKTRKKK